MRLCPGSGRPVKKIPPCLAIPLATAVMWMGDGFPGVMPRSFLVPGAVVLIIISFLYAWRGRRVAFAMTFVASLITMAPPGIALFNARAVGQGMPCLSLAQMNVLEENDAYHEVIAAAKATGADVLCFQETDPLWNSMLRKGLAPDYSWHAFGAGVKNYGMAMFSRVPFDTAEVIHLHGLPAIRAVFRRGGRTIELINVHLRSPESAADLEQRNLQWEALAVRAGERRTALCIAGDVNTVPWDAAFRKFERITGMAHGANALMPTWPTITGIPLIPLDHVLVSPDCSITSSSILQIPGSDHKGRYTRLQFP